MLHGWLNVNKVTGISSAQTVAKVKGLFKLKKAGHLGTLDCLASGVLPIALEEATKTIPYVFQDLKAYFFTVKWGKQKTTDDIYGSTIKLSITKPKYEQIIHAAESFIGKIAQTPPQFSAIKINGTRAYKLARSGQKVHLKPRLVQVHKLELISNNTINNSTDFFMLCSSGVYVRSIARDLGALLNCFGYVTQLRRTMVGDFKETESLKTEQLTKDKVVSIEETLKSLSKIEISFEEGKKIRKGQEIKLNSLSDLKNCDNVLATICGVPVAICGFSHGYIKPFRVFNI